MGDKAAKKHGRLGINPGPIKVVPDAQREVWHRQRGFRCDHEDGRGRCTSTETRSVWTGDHAAAYCVRHMPGPSDAS